LRSDAAYSGGKHVLRLKFATGVAISLVALGNARAQDFKDNYVGKSSCATEIQSKRPDFSMELDKTRLTYLIGRHLSKITVLLLVQLKPGDNCGVIRDVIELRDLSKEFEFSCVDYQLPADVVIGTSKRNRSTKPVIAVEAWRIDLKERTFSKISHKVSCTDENYADSDGRGDLAEEAQKRTSHQKTSQHRPDLHP